MGFKPRRTAWCRCGHRAVDHDTKWRGHQHKHTKCKKCDCPKFHLHAITGSWDSVETGRTDSSGGMVEFTGTVNGEPCTGIISAEYATELEKVGRATKENSDE